MKKRERNGRCPGGGDGGDDRVVTASPYGLAAAVDDDVQAVATEPQQVRPSPQQQDGYGACGGRRCCPSVSPRAHSWCRWHRFISRGRRYNGGRAEGGANTTSYYGPATAVDDDSQVAGIDPLKPQQVRPHSQATGGLWDVRNIPKQSLDGIKAYKAALQAEKGLKPQVHWRQSIAHTRVTPKEAYR